MNLLREYIRESLLIEAAADLAALRKYNFYVSLDDQGDSFEIGLYNGHPKNDDIIGVISAVHYGAGEAPCMGAYEINWSHVDHHGWGPLLYDLAMELATSKGTGIMSDRNTVSDDARSVWRYYMANRSDVEQIQMDDWNDSLTPGDEADNCDQASAYEKGIKGGTFWDSENEETPWDPYGKEVLLTSPITKMYRWKGASKIAALKKMDRWIEE